MWDVDAHIVAVCRDVAVGIDLGERIGEGDEHVVRRAARGVQRDLVVDVHGDVRRRLGDADVRLIHHEAVLSRRCAQARGEPQLQEEALHLGVGQVDLDLVGLEVTENAFHHRQEIVERQLAHALLQELGHGFGEALALRHLRVVGGCVTDRVFAGDGAVVILPIVQHLLEVVRGDGFPVLRHRDRPGDPQDMLDWRRGHLDQAVHRLAAESQLGGSGLILEHLQHQPGIGREVRRQAGIAQAPIAERPPIIDGGRTAARDDAETRGAVVEVIDVVQREGLYPRPADAERAVEAGEPAGGAQLPVIHHLHEKLALVIHPAQPGDDIEQLGDLSEQAPRGRELIHELGVLHALTCAQRQVVRVDSAQPRLDIIQAAHGVHHRAAQLRGLGWGEQGRGRRGERPHTQAIQHRRGGGNEVLSHGGHVAAHIHQLTHTRNLAAERGDASGDRQGRAWLVEERAELAKFVLRQMQLVHGEGDVRLIRDAQTAGPPCASGVCGGGRGGRARGRGAGAGGRLCGGAARRRETGCRALRGHQRILGREQGMHRVRAERAQLQVVLYRRGGAQHRDEENGRHERNRQEALQRMHPLHARHDANGAFYHATNSALLHECCEARLP